MSILFCPEEGKLAGYSGNKKIEWTDQRNGNEVNSGQIERMVNECLRECLVMIKRYQYPALHTLSTGDVEVEAICWSEGRNIHIKVMKPQYRCSIPFTTGENEE